MGPGITDGNEESELPDAHNFAINIARKLNKEMNTWPQTTPQNRDAIPATLIPVPSTIASSQLGMDRKKILIVDDSAIVLKTLSMKLKSNGYDVLTAEDGAVAVST